MKDRLHAIHQRQNQSNKLVEVVRECLRKPTFGESSQRSSFLRPWTMKEQLTQKMFPAKCLQYESSNLKASLDDDTNFTQIGGINKLNFRNGDSTQDSGSSLAIEKK